MITVFYDGKCGLCRKEIDYYKQIAMPGIFIWLDITHINPDQLLSLNIHMMDGLRSLHVQGDDGQIHKGMDAFLLIWEKLPRFYWLFRFVRLRPIYKIAAYIYDKFAAWRFNRMGYPKCDI